MGEFDTQRAGNFESYSRDTIAHNLGVFEPHWEWIVPIRQDGDHAFKFSKLSLESTFISNFEHASALEAIGKRDLPWTNYIFVLTGEVKVCDLRAAEHMRIRKNCVASVGNSTATKLVVSPESSWLVFQVPTAVLSEAFEELTGKPDRREFTVPPTDFRQDGAWEFYQILRQAEREMRTAKPVEEIVLARAYNQLAVVKLLTRLLDCLSPVPDGDVRTRVPFQLLKAEAYMRDNLCNSITLEDIVKAANCSARTLQRMFRFYRKSTPTGVLCSYRLAAAHNIIMAAQVENITDLALSFQFSNPGRFLVLYKKAYGCSPSFALRSPKGKDSE